LKMCELATNGLKDLRIVFNSNQNINLSLPREWCDIGMWSPGARSKLSGPRWFRHRFVGLSDKLKRCTIYDLLKFALIQHKVEVGIGCFQHK